MTSADLHPQLTPILDLFAAISAVPRPSGHEAAIASWLLKWGEKQGFESVRDSVGNIVIRVPATPGMEQAPTLILQNHMDMVCEKEPESRHDFRNDPLRLVTEGDWLRADETTLGADNGIGMALALALATHPALAHPELELLFTVEEETGLTGAQGLDASLLKGRLLLNLDSEREGLFTIGCAGGEEIHLELPMERNPLPPAWRVATVTAAGLQGGHSGMDIAKGRGNANKILAELLDTLDSEGALRILSLQGGSRSNVIPRRAEAVVAFPPEASGAVAERLQRFAAEIAGRFAEAEPDLVVTLSVPVAAGVDRRALTPESAGRCLRLLLEIPDGVRRMEKNAPELVATSNNLAVIRCEEGALQVLSLQRSSRMAELDLLSAEIAGLAARLGGRSRTDGRYPAWEPQPDSALLRHCCDLYRRLFQTEPVLHVTHGGLECGVLSAKLPGAEMLSLGPDIENPHSPGERAHLPSIVRVYYFLQILLGSLG
ncbi:MAG: beta-Ala-His dipeptidase [Deltaproteobacteria bacterium]|nr:beta-Ala-His dipeptidase [Deltaproteobacteria bacterium]